MTALYIIFGIIAFFVIILSINLGVTIDYSEKILVTVKWLFLNIPVYDSSKPKKKKKKDKKKNSDKEKNNTEEKPIEEETEENTEEIKSEEKKKSKPKKEKKPGNGLLKQLYLDLGYDGIEKMLRELCRSLNTFFGKLYKTVTVDDFNLEMMVAGSDSADTAIKYGKLSSWVFPTLGKLISTCKVKKYNVNIYPDFLAKESKGAFYTEIHITPLVVLNAAIVLAVALVFKVLLKILFSNSKSKKSRQQPVNKPNVKKPITNNAASKNK